MSDQEFSHDSYNIGIDTGNVLFSNTSSIESGQHQQMHLTNPPTATNLPLKGANNNLIHRSTFVDVPINKAKDAPQKKLEVTFADERGIPLTGFELFFASASKYVPSANKIVVALLIAIILFLLYLLLAGVNVSNHVKTALQQAQVRSDSVFASELLQEQAHKHVAGHRAFLVPDNPFSEMKEFTDATPMIEMTDQLLQEASLQLVLLTAQRAIEKYNVACIVPGMFMEPYNILALSGGVSYFNVNITAHNDNLQMIKYKSITEKTSRYASMYSQITIAHKSGTEVINDMELAYCIQNYYDKDSGKEKVKEKEQEIKNV